jgi:xanthine dehydrogenase accessory factor
MSPKPIFAFLGAEAKAGRNSALVTVTAVSGASTRNPGTHMGVSESGAFVGSLSGGCIEAAVVGEAIAAMREGRPRQRRFGAGSPYIDIRLPCGGGIDLLFNPLSTSGFAGKVEDIMAMRHPALIDLPTGEGLPVARIAAPKASVVETDTGFRAGHWPALRLVILGHGASVDALRQQAIALGVETVALSPDQMIVDRALANAAEAARLAMPGPSAHFVADSWTAVVFYFHDHDWEGALMAQALRSLAFYIGAMGSRKTHAERLEMLKAYRVAAHDAARIISPIGLIPSSRDPETLALSTLAQVVQAYHARLAEAFAR